MTVNILEDDAYIGIIQSINDYESMKPADILDDLEECHDNVGLELKDTGKVQPDDDPAVDMSTLLDSIKEVSKGVSEKTGQEYGRCDELNLNNTKKDASIERHSFTHAQKMRAAATFGFGRVHGLGMQAWHRSETTGKMLGNPSVSETLTSYMLSLRRRKTQIGETATSACAATSPQFREPQPFQSTARNTPKNSQDWAGARARSLLDLGYSLAFCGLLRVDELLKIQLHDIEFEEINGRWKLTLQLPFRKTSQFGAIKPFVWWIMPEEYSHLCVVRAFARWIVISDITNGYLFRKIHANDRIAEENEPMTSEQFLEMFRNNLIDIGVDHIPYGTHSFRHGGCQ
ncbi:hypothetical protein C8R41DRAFT_912944 [Lentinula lateritia]|uniref:DNA breaking-rejoining enzyme n=1 Tax=Lentinula lateritia TaxID=40482 RepID=A0ABQ8W0Z0_9AGAR|nr:hypothetical protein C8R41DRAFT_912944 [Lentinula lateritia]